MMRLKAFGRRNRFGEILLSPDGQQIKRQQLDNLTSWIGLFFLADSVNFLPKFLVPRLLFLPS